MSAGQMIGRQHRCFASGCIEVVDPKYLGRHLLHIARAFFQRCPLHAVLWQGDFNVANTIIPPYLHGFVLSLRRFSLHLRAVLSVPVGQHLPAFQFNPLHMRLLPRRQPQTSQSTVVSFAPDQLPLVSRPVSSRESSKRHLGGPGRSDGGNRSHLQSKHRRLGTKAQDTLDMTSVDYDGGPEGQDDHQGPTSSEIDGSADVALFFGDANDHVRTLRENCLLIQCSDTQWVAQDFVRTGTRSGFSRAFVLVTCIEPELYAHAQSYACSCVGFATNVGISVHLHRCLHTLAVCNSRLIQQGAGGDDAAASGDAAIPQAPPEHFNKPVFPVWMFENVDAEISASSSVPPSLSILSGIVSDPALSRLSSPSTRAFAQSSGANL